MPTVRSGSNVQRFPYTVAGKAAAAKAKARATPAPKKPTMMRRKAK